MPRLTFTEEFPGQWVCGPWRIKVAAHPQDGRLYYRLYESGLWRGNFSSVRAARESAEERTAAASQGKDA